MKYFSKVTADYWTAKNNAEKEAKIMARNLERRIINGSAEKQKFIDNIKEQVEKINQDNKRCKPLHLSIWTQPINREDCIIDIPGVFTMELFYVVEEL